MLSLLAMLYRAHEWLAERCRSVQFPPERRILRPIQPAAGFHMPLEQALLVGVLGIVALAIAAIALFLLGILFWAILTTS